MFGGYKNTPHICKRKQRDINFNTHTQMKTTKKTTNEIITEKVINGLKTQGLNWFKPWSSNGDTLNLPISYDSKKPYTGINALILSGAMQDNGWSRPEFLTFKQVTNAGGTVIKGSKSEIVTYWIVSFLHKPTNVWYNNEKALNEAGYKKNDEDVLTNFNARFYYVFNIEQTEGVKPLDINIDKVTEGTVFEKIDNAEKVYAGYKNAPKLKHGGNQAYYRPSADLVNMPVAKSFVDNASYYKTLFHELAHSTGHEDRLNRIGVSNTSNVVASFGSDIYSQEELVAEMASMFLVSVTGIEPKDNMNNSQAYINGWVKKLTDHPKMIMQASAQADKAVKHILSVC